MTGTFGTLTFDDGWYRQLVLRRFTAADVSYSTTVGAVSLTVAHDAQLQMQHCKFFLSWIQLKWNGIHINCF
jgi:hypothetical protein